MKKLFFLALPFLLLGCGEDSSSDTVLPPSAPASVITVTPASYDFGTVNAGETKTAHFTVNTDGFVTSHYGVDVVDMLGLNADDAENTLKTMYQNQTTTDLFSLSFTPICKGNISGKLFIVTDRYGGASITIPITAVVTDDTNTLPKCSSENPVITVTSSPENMIKTGMIKGIEGTQKYIDFSAANTNKITITAVSDTYLSGGSSSTSTGGTFNSKVTFWELKDNKVSATAEITFNPDSCSGPASDRIKVNGLDETSVSSYLYIIGTGTAVDEPECSNRYPLQTN